MSEKEKERSEKEKEVVDHSLFLKIMYLLIFIGFYEITKNIYVFLIVPIIFLLIDILEELMIIRRKIEEMKNE
ncbi:MAG: hypothetical protein RXR31_02770 [Thermoproteota archaeon]